MTIDTLEQAFEAAPVVAILRGVRPDEAVEIGHTLVEAGIRVIEAPLNSPDPYKTIARLAEALAGEAIVGAGTVLTRDQADAVADAGGRIAVAPNADPAVIGRIIEKGMEPMPGFFTATEAFCAVAAGARWLKLFPAATAGMDHIGALDAVLPSRTRILAVGGVGPDNAQDWIKAGAYGVGIGSDIFRPDDSAGDVAAKARRLMDALARDA